MQPLLGVAQNAAFVSGWSCAGGGGVVWRYRLAGSPFSVEAQRKALSWAWPDYLDVAVVGQIRSGESPYVSVGRCVNCGAERRTGVVHAGCPACCLRRRCLGRSSWRRFRCSIGGILDARRHIVTTDGGANRRLSVPPAGLGVPVTTVGASFALSFLTTRQRLHQCRCG